MATKIYGGEDTPLVQHINPKLNKWMILWNRQIEEDSVSYQSEVFMHKPSVTEVKDTILNWYNSEIDQDILTGLIWNNTPVWLSKENQFNYKAAYDLAIQTNGQSLPVVFKLGTVDKPVYYKFETLEELNNFYISAINHISKTLEKGWEIKENLDWKIYEDLLK